MPRLVDINIRDHVRYTGDGLPGEPVNAPLPVGDPSSGVYHPTKKDIRDAIGDIEGDRIATEAAAELARQAMVDAQGATFQAANLSALLANNAASYPAGTIFATRAEGYGYEVVSAPAVPDLTTAGGVLLRLVPGLSVVTPAMFGAVGVKSVGDLAVTGHAAIPDETSKIQRMFDYAVEWGAEVHIGPTDRDFGITAPIVVDPQTNRNRGNTNALASGGLLALHFSNMPSLVVRNPGNARIVAKSAMPAMFRINNVAAAFQSTAPYWTVWDGMNLHGNNLAVIGIETDWSYRNHYSRCRVFGCDYGWQAKQDAGSLWSCCEINCAKAAIWLDNAGDCMVFGGDISVQLDGVRCGGGNNVRVTGVTFTGNGFSESDMVGVRLFGGSTVTADYRTRGVHITGCEGAGIDWLVKGNDGDADGKKEIWNITLTDNHIVRNAFRPGIGMCWLRNAFGVGLRGNGHGDLLNAAATTTSIYLEGCETVTIDDHLHKFEGNAIHLKSCIGGAIRSQFSECAVTTASPIIHLENTLEFAITGCSCRWHSASPPAGSRFVTETGSSNRNVAGLNAIDRAKMGTPYTITGAASVMT